MERPIRDRVSTKARTRSYTRMRSLFDFLEKLIGYSPYTNDESLSFVVDFKGWKQWNNKYTPSDKRGGPAKPSKRRKSKLKDRQNTIS